MSRKAVFSVGAAAALVATAAAYAWWYKDLGHGLVEKLPHLHGRPIEAVVAELGEPDSRDEFAMADCGDKFRCELFNTYPPTDPRTAGVRIIELQWDRSRYHIAVWFHEMNGEWVVLNTCHWKKGVEF